MNATPIGSFANFINGYAFKPEDWGQEGSPIIRIQNLTGLSEVFNQFNGVLPEQFKVRAGDILISWSASLGVYIWDGADAYLNQHIFRVELSPGVDRLYFYYAMMSVLDEMLRQVHGSTMQHITKDRFEAVKIPLPSLAEQRRIAAILSAADDERRRRRYTLELSDNLMSDVLVQMFGDAATNPMKWSEHYFGDLLAVPPRIGTTQPASDQGSQLCIRVGELGRHRDVDLDACKFVSLDAADLQRYEVQSNDVLLARAIGSEEQLGKFSIMQRTDRVVVFDSHVMRLRLNRDRLDLEYFCALMRTAGGRSRFLQQGRATAVQFNINTEQLQAIKIPLPPMTLQSKFATVAATHARTFRQQAESARQSDHLFQALLHQAFSGDL